MNFFYGDDSDISGINNVGIPNIHLYGGALFTDDNSIIIKEAIEKLKIDLFGNSRAPVKWNIQGLKGDYKVTLRPPAY